MNKRHLPFWLLIISFFFILIVRNLFRDGMFMDGLLYATVANNLASGLGSFWHPYHSLTFLPAFHEEPPLLYGIEAVFFKIFGNSMYIERIYGLLVSLITVFLIHKIWKCIFQDRQEKNISWLPVLFWLSIPVCFWSYANNMEEPTMGMFDLAAVLFICKAMVLKTRTWLNLGMAVLMLIAASLTKGLQGLFPLVSIFLIWAVFRKISFSRMIAGSAFLLLGVVAFYEIILLNETVRSSFEMYFNNRLVTTFKHPGPQYMDRFYIIKQFFSEFLPVFILMLAGGIFIGIKKKYSTIDKDIRSISILFLLIALSGTLPLMLTIEQSGYYLVTVIPYFAIGFAALLAPVFSSLIEQIKMNSKKLKIWTIFTSLLLIISIVYSVLTIKYIPKRDKEMLHDVYCTGKIIKNGNIVGIPKKMYGECSLHGYFSRYFYISLDSSLTAHKYFLTDKTFDPKLVPPDYKIVILPTQKYNLYIKNP